MTSSVIYYSTDACKNEIYLLIGQHKHVNLRNISCKYYHGTIKSELRGELDDKVKKGL